MTNILLTGSAGFLGGYIFRDLSKSAKVITLSRTAADIIADLSIKIPQLPSVDLVIHCAGKAHSNPKTAVEIQKFFQVNVDGTKNLLKGLEQSPTLPRYFVYISSVAVYGLDHGTNIDEKSPLLARDAYGLSKVQAEELIIDWCKNSKVICTILRLPLLVGNNPPGNLGAMIRAIEKGYYFNIGGGKARKSMVLADDVAAFITTVATVGGIFNITDGFHPNFKALSSAIMFKKNRKSPRNLPLFTAKLMGFAGDLLGHKLPINSSKVQKITSDLTFDDTKARELAGWKSNKVINWFKEYNC